MKNFITFEGADGSGKTSVINYVFNRLKEEGFGVINSREPGGCQISEKIRDILLDKENDKLDYVTEALLFAASRNQHLHEIIVPALENNKIVLCDRFVDSSYAYQGIARNVGLEKIMNINSSIVEAYMPDLTVYIDVESSICLNRIKNNRGSSDRIDSESLQFHIAVRNGYLKLCEMFKDRIVKIDGSQELEKVCENAYSVVYNYLRGIK